MQSVSLQHQKNILLKKNSQKLNTINNINSLSYLIDHLVHLIEINTRMDYTFIPEVPIFRFKHYEFVGVYWKVKFEY